MFLDLWGAFLCLVLIALSVAGFCTSTILMVKFFREDPLHILVVLFFLVSLLCGAFIYFVLGPPLATLWNACSGYTSKHEALFFPLWIASDISVAFYCARRMYSPAGKMYAPPAFAFAIGVAFAAIMYGMRWGVTLPTMTTTIDLSSYAISLLCPGSLLICLIWIIIKAMDEKGLL